MKIICLFTILGISLSTYAVPVKELQELRLAKAELAHSEGNDKRAMQYIKQNINQKHFHLETYLFLMDYYQEKELFIKSLRVARYLIKKMHGKSFLKMKTLKELEETAARISKPSTDSLLLYFKLGRLFYGMWQKKTFSHDFENKLFSMSLKYFSICDYYKFAPAQTSYYLAILKREDEQYNEAINHLFQLQELLEDSEDNEQKDHIDYLLADSLIREGYTDAGSIYLRSIQSSSGKYSQIKEYASNYLDNISQRNNYFSMALNYGIYHNSNVHDLNNNQIKNFDSVYKNTYLRKAATMSQYGVDSIASLSVGKYWSLKFTGDFSESRAKKRDLYFTDFREWGLRIDLKYFNLIKSQLKLTFALSNREEKSLSNRDFFLFSKSHLLQLQYTHTLKKGIITYSIPVSFSEYPQYSSTNSYGASLSYSRYRTAPFWSPSFSAIIKKNSEYDAGTEDSLQISATASNYMLLSNNISCFLWGRLLHNQNSDQDHAYSLFSLNTNLIVLPPFSNKMTIDSGISWQFIPYQNSSNISQWILSVKFSYLFD